MSINISEDCVSNSTTGDYGTHTVSVTHLNAFGRSDMSNVHEITNGTLENNDDEQNTDTSSLNNNLKGRLGKNDLKNINKLAAKKISKSKAFAHIKQQSNKKEAKSVGGKKASVLKKKFSKKCAESKRSKHYNPKNKTHKKNKV